MVRLKQRSAEQEGNAEEHKINTERRSKGGGDNDMEVGGVMYLSPGMVSLVRLVCVPGLPGHQGQHVHCP